MIEIRHLLPFCILFTLSVFRPEALLETYGLSLAPMVPLFAVSFLVYQIKVTTGFKAFLRSYRYELISLLLYTAICSYSIMLSIASYGGSLVNSLQYVVIQSVFPILLLFFSLPSKRTESHKTASVIFILFLVLNFVTALSQKFFWGIGEGLTSLFIAGNIPHAVPVRGIFATSTDMAAICALIIVSISYYIYYAGQTLRRSTMLWITAVFVVLLISALLSSSRNLFFTLGTVIVFVLLTSNNISKKWKILMFSSLFFLFHVFVYLSPLRMVQKLSLFFPYLRDFHNGDAISFTELVSTSFSLALGPRASMWQETTQFIQNNPVWGTSNAGFRLLSQTPEYSNTHNFVLQTLIDSGLVGTLLLLVLWGLILKRIFRFDIIHRGYLLVLGIAILASNSVDYFPDHSLPWIVVAAFLLASVRPSENMSKLQKNVLSIRNVTWLFVGSGMLFLLTCGHYTLTLLAN